MDGTDDTEGFQFSLEEEGDKEELNKKISEEISKQLEKYQTQLSQKFPNAEFGYTKVIAKRTKVLQRILLAKYRERQRANTSPSDQKIAVDQKIESQQNTQLAPKTNPFFAFKKASATPTTTTTPKEPFKVSDSQTSRIISQSGSKFTESLQKSLSLKPISNLPMSLTYESPENISNLVSKIEENLKEKKITKQDRATLLNGLLALGFSTGSLSQVVDAVSRMIEVVTASKDEKIGDFPQFLLKKIEDYRKYFNLSVFCPYAFLGSFKYQWNPQGRVSGRPRNNYTDNGMEVMATDGKYLYVHNNKGLVKIGTGKQSKTQFETFPFVGLTNSLKDTDQGQIYGGIPGYRPNDKATDLSCVSGKLFFTSNLIQPVGAVAVIDCETLNENGIIDLASIRTKSPIVQKSLEGISVSNTNPITKICSDGTYLYTIIETTSTTPPDTNPFKRYWLDVFSVDPKEIKSSNLEKRLEFIAEDPKDIKGHRNCSCDACGRIGFTENRFTCQKCHDFDLCGLCKDSLIYGNSAVFPNSHSFEHPMELCSQPPKPVASKASLPIPTLTADCINRGTFFTTGSQLVVLMGSKVAPNKFDRYVCRVFNISGNKCNFDIDVDSKNLYLLGNPSCYDPVNNLLWNLLPGARKISYYRNFGPLSNSAATSENSQTHPSNVSWGVTISRVLDNLEQFSLRASPLGQSNVASDCADVYKTLPFTVDPNSKLFHALLLILDLSVDKTGNFQFFFFVGLQITKAYQICWIVSKFS